MMKKISTALTLIIIIIILAVTLKNNKDMNDIKNIISPNAVTQEKVGKSTTSNKTNKKIANSEISTPNNSSSIKELTKVDVVSKYI